MKIPSLPLYKKNLFDHIRSKRFMIILLIVAVTCLANVYSAGLGIRAAVRKNKTVLSF